MRNLEKLSLKQLETRLEELNAEWHAVEQAIEARKIEDKEALAQEIKYKVREAGYDVGEIAGLIQAKKGGANRKKTNGGYTRYVDPDNSDQVYVRGVLPNWLKEKMKAKGFDPAAKADRDQFRDKYLKREAT
jgi:DNA-binding protein H-NS